jgi:glycosyltransferase involved in cell wall biosynthesis
MVQQKRPLDFVRTAELLQQRWKDTKQTGELHFIIVGGGPLFKDVKTAVNKAQLQNNFHFHDELNDTRPIYRDVDLMVMPSENEGLALVTYEAMAMKVPIFITDVGAQSELLESEFPEFLVPNDRSIAPKLADAAWPYLTDKNKCREKGEELRKYILKHHRAEETFSKMQDLYERLIEKSSALRETVS